MRDRVAVLDAFVVSTRDDHALTGKGCSDGNTTFAKTLLRSFVGCFEGGVEARLGFPGGSFALVVGHAVILACE
ncbi:hypothetical protein ACVWZ8_004714 [Arthrobacter sp. UYCu723]